MCWKNEARWPIAALKTKTCNPRVTFYLKIYIFKQNKNDNARLDIKVAHSDKSLFKSKINNEY